MSLTVAVLPADAHEVCRVFTDAPDISPAWSQCQGTAVVWVTGVNEDEFGLCRSCLQLAVYACLARLHMTEQVAT